MAIEHHWVTDELLHTKYLGKVTGEDMLKAAEDIAADPRFESIRFVIGDWSYIKEAIITAEHVRELAAYILAISKTYPRVKNASVVANYESGVARASLYDLLADGTSWETATFATCEEAFNWFGINLQEKPNDH